MFGYLELKTLHIASVGALVSLACIFSVALSRNPAGFFRHLPGVAGS